MEVPQNGWIILENPIKLDETSISAMSKIHSLQQCSLNLGSTFISMPGAWASATRARASHVSSNAASFPAEGQRRQTGAW